MINFVLNKAPHYVDVQTSLLTQVTPHLSVNGSTTVGTYRPGAVNFSLFVREPADVVMSHGVADKNYFNDVLDERGVPFANRASHLFLPGPWLKRKLLACERLNFDEERLVVVGWPRLDVLRDAAANFAPEPLEGRRPIVLWAPTHDFRKRGPEAKSTSSYPDFLPFAEQLRDLCDLRISTHPSNRESKKPTVRDLVECDIVISDFGTMVYEAWALGKPVIFPRWLLGDRIQQYTPGSAEAFIFEQNLGYHPRSFSDLRDLIGPEATVSPEVRSFMDDYLHVPNGKRSGQVIADALARIWHSRTDSRNVSQLPATRRESVATTAVERMPTSPTAHPAAVTTKIPEALETLPATVHPARMSPGAQGNVTKPPITGDITRIAECKICESTAVLSGLIDFSRDLYGRNRASGLNLDIPVPYYKCRDCEFGFTPSFDNWTAEDFRTHVYNDDYHLYDPRYAEERPRKTSMIFQKLFRSKAVSVLDFGAGNGLTAALLREAGYASVTTYDPFQGNSECPAGPFDIVMSIEVVEHSVKPMDLFRELSGLCHPQGVLFISTKDFTSVKGFWLDAGYVAPRNGHVSLFSRPNLTLIAQRLGRRFHSLDAHRHVFLPATGA